MCSVAHRPANASSTTSITVAVLEKLSALVNEKTGGNFNIVLHYGGALSKSRENLDGISIDAFAMWLPR